MGSILYESALSSMEASGICLHMSAFVTFAGQSWNIALSRVCGRVRFPPDWRSGPNWWRTLKDHDLWFVWAGRGVMEIDGRPCELRAGTCVWMQPGRSYVTTHDPAHPLGVNFFHFGLNRDRRVSASSPTRPAAIDHFIVRHFDFADTLMRRILRIREEPEGRTSADQLFAALLQEIVRDAQQSRPLARSVRNDHSERMRAVAARIRANPAAAPTIAVMAREAGYSISHFSRTFAAVNGERPQAFVIRSRLECARELLATTSMTISSIAEAIGIPEVFYLSRLFKARTGVAPSEYRRRVQELGG